MNEQELEYAGFWVRVGANLIDGILILLITVPLLMSIYGTEHFVREEPSLIAGPAEFLISWVLPAVVCIVFWIFKQATPGKMAVSAKIVDAQTGKTPSAGQYIGRYFAYFVSMLPLFLGFLWVAFDRKKQGWHDKLAGTVVVRRVQRGPAPVTFKQTGQ